MDDTINAGGPGELLSAKDAEQALDAVLASFRATAQEWLGPGTTFMTVAPSGAIDTSTGDWIFCDASDPIEREQVRRQIEDFAKTPPPDPSSGASTSRR